MPEFLPTLYTIAAVLVVCVPAVLYVNKRQAVHWENLAATYARQWRRPLRKRNGNLVLYGSHPMVKAYNGITQLGIHEGGVALRVWMPPDSFFSRPLFIPFGHITGWNQTWYANSKSVELQFKAVPEVKLVMPRDQVEWIRQVGGPAVQLHDAPSPHRARPVFWLACGYVVFFLSVLVFGVEIYRLVT